MPSTTLTKEDILELETSYWEAMKAKDGRKTASLSGDPSLVSGMQGVMRIPRAKMSDMTESDDWELLSYSFENVEFSSPTPNVAIVAYTVRQTVRLKGEEKEFRAADASTWVHDGSSWACYAHSETILNN